MVYAPGSTPGGTGSQIGDLLVGRPSQIGQGTRMEVGGSACGTWMRSRRTVGGYGHTLTLEIRRPSGLLDQQRRANGLGAWFDSAHTIRRRARFSTRRRTQLNGVRYTSRGQAPPASSPTEGPSSATDQRGVGHQRQRHDRPSWRLRPVREPAGRGTRVQHRAVMPPNAQRVESTRITTRLSAERV